MQRKYIYSMLFVIAVAAAGISYTFANNNKPLLGLDLQGGVSVVLKPTETASDGALNQTVEILRGRIDDIGVAEPEISKQGQNIVVALPGVIEDQQQALDRLGRTAELRFRPVILDLGSNPELNLSAPEVETSDPVTEDIELEEGSTTSVTTEEEPDSDENAVSLGGVVEPAAFFQDPVITSTIPESLDENSESTLAGDSEEGAVLSEEDIQQALEQQALEQQAQSPIFESCLSGLTPTDSIKAEDYIVVGNGDENFPLYYCLGPTLLTGDALETAVATLGGGGDSTGWSVNPTFKDGPDGIDLFNAASAACFNADPNICPSTSNDGRGRLAAVLDFRVISAPTINAEVFRRDQIVISGTFDKEEAEETAEALRFGALPIELEAQETRTVSAAIGGDVLRAGVISGLIGLSLVAVYLLLYYRLAGIVAISGLLLSAMILWTIVAWFGEKYGLALSISGVVGLIVSIGVSTDSNIVYFENVKEAFSRGSKLGTSAERAYQTSISTIIKADVVSLIAAVLLYFLAVGAVRGFAFYLGLATLLDLFISMYFMRPALIWLAKRSAVKANPRLLGMRAGSES